MILDVCPLGAGIRTVSGKTEGSQSGLVQTVPFQWTIRTNETRMKRRNAILDEICLTDARPRRASDRTMHATPPTNHSRILRLKDL